MKIAVDVMGTDYGPEQIILGAVQASEAYSDCTVILVGDSSQIQEILKKHQKQLSDKIQIKQASQVIEMSEHPGVAVRKKKDSSIVVATRLLKDNECDAVVSSGSTGAAVAAALFGLGRITGVERPTIATPIPNVTGTTVVLDSGANVDSKPQHLEQSAVMGYIYAKHVLRINNPRVGLLNIGEEDTKGNEQAIATYPLLMNNKHINFIGNVEGRDISNGNVDVVVCDGFVGNVVLKFAEGLSSAILSLIRQTIKESNLITKLAAYFVLPVIRKLKKKVDPAEYGGAPLLGVNGEFIICHGSSKAKAIKNAVRVAMEFKRNKVIDSIKEKLQIKEANY